MTVVLVTGAAGFIGGHLAERLAADGYKVRCLVKPDSDKKQLDQSGVEVVVGDLREPASLRSAVKGVDRVYHLAALARLYAWLKPEDYTVINSTGTRNLLEAAHLAGVKRFVHVSTFDAVGPSRDGTPVTEDTPCQPVNDYGRSKLEGERAVREYSAKGLPCVIVRPPAVYGPRSTLHCARLFRPVSKGWYPLFGDGNTLMELNYVGNQVEGIMLAGEKDRAVGNAYFISDERSYTINEVLHAVAKAVGREDLQIVRIPAAAGLAIGAAVEAVGKVVPIWPFRVPETGRPAFSRNTVRWTTNSTWFCSCEKAKRELGYRPSYSLEEGTKLTAAWLRENGHLGT
jgi:nucleoside-diphosphate-sugar epimerase